MAEEVKKPVGAVMVVGAGIAGMQSALDLANSGFKVYLVEGKTAIGGKMAQLDKTFPTNDCAMCIISPKLVEVGRHRNIDILTNTRVDRLSGSVGHFQAHLLRRPRHIQLDKCTGCGECATKCPVDLPDGFNLDMSKRCAVYKLYAQAIPGGFAVEKTGISPCRFACPAGVNAHAYVALIAKRRFAEALAVQRRANPFPAICGRVCPHACELECTRGKLDQPLAIADLKRFLADWEMANPDQKPEPPRIEDRQEKVAVIGGGRAGLTAARELRLKGFQVTVFEAMPAVGGTLTYFTPGYKLPRKLTEHEIQTSVLDLGVEVKNKVRLGKDTSVDQLRRQGYRAFVLAVGAQARSKLDLPGAAKVKEGLVDASAYLRDLSLGMPRATSGHVLVTGKGVRALDAARSALRLGAESVTFLQPLSKEQLSLDPAEIEQAELEGVQFKFRCRPVKVLESNGRLSSVECQETVLGPPDATGRRRPLKGQGEKFELPAQMLIAATSRRTDAASLGPDLSKTLSTWGHLKVDDLTLQTAVEDVFAAGEVVSGPSAVIESIEAGKRAAESVERYLSGWDLSEGREPPDWVPLEKDVEGLPRSQRTPMTELSAEERRDNFLEVKRGYSEEEAVAEAARCLNCAICCECLMCVEACQAEAVVHESVREVCETVEVGSVVLAPGFEMFDPQVRDEFGYGRYRNVITSIEFERILSASGPTEGHVIRPSDSKPPERIAWIQCVGSRDSSCERDYCSSVCCMYATKEALIAKEHDPRISPTIFFIDLRAFGKGFDEYVERAQEHHGVRYLRAMVSRVFEDPVTCNLELRYLDESGKRHSEEFDLVVLSVGLQISEEARALAKRLRVDLDEFGFARTDTFKPLATNRPGVFVSGVFSGPKDIPETVSEASGAAGAAASELAASRGELVTEEVFPPERPIPEDEPLKVGVFVCHCGINIAAIVDVEEVAEYARSLPGVVYADNLLYTCSQDNQVKIRDIIKEQGLNRVIVASCSPRTHEPLFQQTLSQAGLNKYLFDMANIRDQCSWVHRRDNRQATEKAKRLLRMAVANVSQSEPLEEREFDVDSGLLVVGGGLAGMTAALQAARQGFTVHLVERQESLGGHVKSLRRTAGGESLPRFLEELVARVEAEPLVRVYTGSEIVAHTGYIGSFETEIMTPAGVARKIKHGATIVATGGREARPEIYGLGEDDRVWTQTEFEQKLDDDKTLGEKIKSVVMIQCAGSRDEKQPYCSRVCCGQAIKNAIYYKKRFPGSRVDVLYRDVRSYGISEILYRDARRAGVNFIRYDPESNPPRVENPADGLKVTLLDPSIQRQVELKPDALVLSVGMLPSEVEELGTMLRIPRAPSGFFIEAHAKLRPVDFASEGLFLAGVAHGPKSISETVSQASAAVARAATILSKPKLRLSGVVSTVNPDQCAVCLTCVRACPYGVPVVNQEHTAEINPAMCQGCGICAAECPAKAIVLGHFRDAQLVAKLNALTAPVEARR